MQMDQMSEAAQRALAANHPDLMSAFGNAADFFEDDGDFSFVAFERWINSSVLKSGSTVTEDIVSWLPDEDRVRKGR